MTRVQRRLAGTTYAVLLALSFLVRARQPDPPPPVAGQAVAVLPARRGDAVHPGRVSLAYQNIAPQPPDAAAPVVVLLHGSPGEGGEFDGMAATLRRTARVLVPDLPGFGHSSRTLPDYSFRAHGAYVVDLLDRLGVARAHVVGFSMGGGVALSMAGVAPSRVASLTLLSAIGVQEMELLGEYRVNHAVHGLQLGALWFLREALPHFGILDRAPVGVPYARNFYDSDQRPLRAILERTSVPVLIIHGRRDVLVPYEAAVEHHRIAPQSELHTTDAGHFMVFTDAAAMGRLVADFVTRAERGQARTRDLAEPSRIVAARAPFDPSNLPRFQGVAAFTTGGLLAAATLVSEDLASIAAGVLVAQDRLSFAVAAVACFVGILVGDLLLFVAGRLAGRRILLLPGMSHLVSADALARSSAWLERRGAVVVFASRFVPGTRLPTCLAAGLLDTSAWRFALWFALACAVWTPVIVGGAALIGEPILTVGGASGGGILLRAAVAVVAAALLLRLAVSWVAPVVRRRMGHEGERTPENGRRQAPE